MKHISLSVFISGIMLFMAFTANAQPSNNDCGGATMLNINAAPTSGDVNGATQSVSGCTGTANDDVWYYFTTGSVTGNYVITVVPSVNFDAVVDLRAGGGGCPSSSLVCRNDGGAGITETITFASSASTTYYVRVYDAATGYPPTTTFTIQVTLPIAPPSNNDCSGAASLTVNAAPVTGNVSGATQTVSGCTGTANDDVWYYFTTASVTGNYQITVVPSGSFDAVVDLRAAGGGCPSSSIQCSNSAGAGGTEILTFASSASTTYYVRVYDFGSGFPATTTFTIQVILPIPPPSNNDCSGATSLTVNAAPTAGDVNGATQTVSGCTGTANDDVWYYFTTASVTGNYQITVVPSGSFDAVIDLRAGGGGCPSSSIQCKNDAGAGATETLTFASAASTTYYVRVYDAASGFPATTTFTIQVTLPTPPPSNNDCSGATSLTVNAAPVTGNVNGATQTVSGCTGTANDDVWYYFTTASITGNYQITVVPSGSFDAVIDLRAGGGGCPSSSIQCTNSGLAGVTETLSFASSASTTYYVRVYDYASGYPATTTFTIQVTLPTPPPLNNDCSGATQLTVNAGPTTGDVFGATQVTSGCSGNANDDVWYYFTTGPVTANHTITVVPSSNFDAVIDLRAGGGGCPSSNIQCKNTGGAGVTEALTVSLSASTTYYVRVYDYNAGYPATTTFTVQVTVLTPPSNNDCGGATSLTVNAAPTAGDVNGATQTVSGCTGTANDDVWYYFTTGSVTGNYQITVVPSGSFDAVVDLRAGGGGCPSSSIQCTNSTGAGGTETLSFASSASTTYYVRVYDFGSGYPATTTFTIQVTLPITPPPNNDCSGAAQLNVNAPPTNGNVSGATQVTSGCVGNANDDVWYYFTTGSVTGNYQITVVPSGSFDAVIDLRAGGGGCPSSNIQCKNDAGAGATETLSFASSASTTYYVRVYDYGSGYPATTTFTIQVTLPTPPPSNNDCSDATALTVNAAPVTGNVSGATQTVSGCTGTANDDVWYYFTTGSITGNYQITVVPSGSFDAVIDLRAGGGGCPSSSIQCTNSGLTGVTETLSFASSASTTYYVRVYDYGSGYPATTTFTIQVTLPTPPPSNNDCSGATHLTVNAGPTAGDVSGATQVTSGCTGNANDDVWYYFTTGPVNATHTISVVPSSNFDAVIDLRAGGGGCPSSNIQCKNAGGGGVTETLVVSLSASTTYYVRVYDYNAGYPATTTFTVQVSVLSPPANNDCGGALQLTVNAPPTNGDVLGATQTVSGCTGNADDDVWYYFTTGSITGNYQITVVPSGNFNAVVDLRAGGGGCPSSSIQCVNNGGTGVTETLAFASAASTTYYVRVYDFGTGYMATTTFTIQVTLPVPPPPNNDCSGAAQLLVNAPPTSGDVNGATQVTSGCIGNANDDVWYYFTTGSVTGNYQVTVVPSGSFDAVIDLRAGGGGCPSSNIQCKNDAGAGATETLSFASSASTTYYVRVYDFGSGFPATTTFTIQVTLPTPPPPNNDCSGATQLVVGDPPVTGDVNGATQTVSGCTGTANDDVWYYFTTGSVSANYVISVISSSAFDAVIDLRAGGGGCPSSSVQCTNATGAGESEMMTVALTPSTTYYVRVYDYGSGYPSTTTFTIRVKIPPFNDICSGAGVLIVDDPPVQGDVNGATWTFPPVCTGNANDDVWYTFSPSTSGTYDVTVVGSPGFDPVIEFRSGICNGTHLGCANNTGAGGTEVYSSSLAAGTTYLVRVYDATNGVPTTTTFLINVSGSSGYTITASAGLHGNISPSGVVPVMQGGSQTFSFSPGACYQVADVLVDGSSVGSPASYTFNNISASHTISVSFSASPALIVCPANVSVNTDPGICEATGVSTGTPDISGNCTGSTVVNNYPSNNFPKGVTTITWTVTTPAGSTATCQQTVTVTDSEPPAITCPADISVNTAPGSCGQTVSFAAPSGTDNCSGQFTVLTTGLNSGSVFPIGTTTNIFQVTDVALQSATCQFTVTVTDNEPPAITCPADITASINPGDCDAVVNYTAPMGTDNCAGAVTTQTAGLPPGSIFPAGSTVNTFTVTDAGGLSSQCSFNVVTYLQVRVLNLKVYLEGLYAGGGMMNTAMDFDSLNNLVSKWGAGVADTIYVEFHDATNYGNIIHTVKNVSLQTDGTAEVMLPAAYNGNYYITVRHRSHLETTSANPVAMGACSQDYDFTTHANQAYGSNMQSTGGIAMIFAGEISSPFHSYPGPAMHDGIIDLGDINYIFMSYLNGDFGYAYPSDINGDGSVDLADIMITFNNYLLSIYAMVP